MILEYKHKGDIAAFVLFISIIGATSLAPVFKGSTASVQEAINQIIGIVFGISFFYILWAYAKANGHSG